MQRRRIIRTASLTIALSSMATWITSAFCHTWIAYCGNSATIGAYAYNNTCGFFCDEPLLVRGWSLGSYTQNTPQPLLSPKPNLGFSLEFQPGRHALDIPLWCPTLLSLSTLALTSRRKPKPHAPSAFPIDLLSPT